MDFMEVQMEEEVLKTRNKWLESNRIVLNRARPRQTRQISTPDFTGTIQYFAVDDTLQ